MLSILSQRKKVILPQTKPQQGVCASSLSGSQKTKKHLQAVSLWGLVLIVNETQEINQLP